MHRRGRGLACGFVVIAASWFLATGTSWLLAQIDHSSGIAAQHSSACIGRTIQSIELPGLPYTDQKSLASMIPLRPGEPLLRNQLQESLRVLFATGRFSDLRAQCQPATDGNIVLSFTSVLNVFVGRITIEGAPGRPTDTQIVNASKLQLGEVFTPEKIERALNNIGRLLQESDFYLSSVTHSERQNTESQQVEITFHINSGPEAHVGKIIIQGNSLFSLGQIEDIAHLHPGDVASNLKVSSGLERLRKKFQKKNRWLAQSSVAEKKYIAATNSVDYTLQIDSGPIVNIGVEGFHLSKGTIQRNVPVYEENALDDDLLNEGRRNLLSYMESRGYFEATVDLKQEVDPKQNVRRVIYQIDAGSKHKVVKVIITGNKYFRDQVLRSLMQVQEASILLTHGRYSQALLRNDIRDMENVYRANGFAKVKIDGQTEDDYRGEKNHLAIMVRIDEGPQTLVGGFRIVGNDTQLDDQLPPFNTGPGQPFSDDKIAQDRDILLNYYFDDGFPNATFEATATPAGNNRVNVTYNIHEGKRTYVDRVFLAGREFTKPIIVEHEMQVHSDDPLSQGDILSTQQRLYDLGIFSQVDTAVQNPEGTETRKNVLVQVQEAKRYTFNYGLGFEFQTGQPSISGKQPLGTSGVSPLASFDVTRLNFLGLAHTITFESRVGRLQQRGLINYEAPRWLNNPDWKLTFTGFFDHTLDVATFTSQRLEGSAQTEQVVSRKSDGSPVSLMTYRFNYRLVKAANVLIDPNLVPLLSQPVRVGEPGFSFIRNRRDDNLETTRGSYITVDAGVAGRYFGSQADFSRALVQFSTYHPFGRAAKSAKQFVFARSTRIGVENPFASTIITQPGEATQSNPTLIPLPERFFMGGGNSHRGFGLNQAGPRDPTTGFPVGGSALFLNNFELRLPTPALPLVHENMSFALFHDMGNVFTDDSHMLDSFLRWHQNKSLCTQSSTAEGPASQQPAMQCNYNYISHAIGLGIRYKTPVGPVRFDLGYNLNPTAYPSFDPGPNTSQTTPTYVFTGTKQASPFNVYFSIGQTF